MRILLTNDDGYASDGIEALQSALGERHEVWLFAPDTERSGMSHAMSLRHPIKIRRMSERVYTCSGTPADCVILSGHGVLPIKPDIVVSGINRGPNLGTDLIYSGTAAAARQASMAGIPGIAVSLAEFKAPFRYEALAALVADELDFFLSLWTPEVFINLNAPGIAPGQAYRLVETEPCRRIYLDVLKVFDGADDHSYCFFTDGKVQSREAGGSDEEAVRNGFASYSRILVHPQAERAPATEATR